MQVVEVFSGGSDEDDTQSAFRPWDSPDFDGQMQVLSWKVLSLTADPPMMIINTVNVFSVVLSLILDDCPNNFLMTCT